MKNLKNLGQVLSKDQLKNIGGGSFSSCGPGKTCTYCCGTPGMVTCSSGCRTQAEMDMWVRNVPGGYCNSWSC